MQGAATVDLSQQNIRHPRVQRRPCYQTGVPIHRCSNATPCSPTMLQYNSGSPPSLPRATPPARRCSSASPAMLQCITTPAAPTSCITAPVAPACALRCSNPASGGRLRPPIRVALQHRRESGAASPCVLRVASQHYHEQPWLPSVLRRSRATSGASASGNPLMLHTPPLPAALVLLQPRVCSTVQRCGSFTTQQRSDAGGRCGPFLFAAEVVQPWQGCVSGGALVAATVCCSAAPQHMLKGDATQRLRGLAAWLRGCL